MEIFLSLELETQSFLCKNKNFVYRNHSIWKIYKLINWFLFIIVYSLFYAWWVVFQSYSI